MSSVACDVVILPNDDLAEKAIMASRALEPLGSLFTLEIGKYYPHSSLYMSQLNKGDLTNIQKLLSAVAAKTSSLKLTASRFYQSENYIDVEYGKTERLAELQKQVIAALNPVRDGMREKDKARMLEATGLALDNFKNYGYKYVGELFRPHITFTRFSQEQADAEKLLPDLSDFDGTFTRIGLFEMGDNGTCVRKIAEFDLQQEAENGD